MTTVLEATGMGKGLLIQLETSFQAFCDLQFTSNKALLAANFLKLERHETDEAKGGTKQTNITNP
jgi:hypothetical protein